MKQALLAGQFGVLLRAPAVAGLVVFGLGLTTALIQPQPARAQLPPVNMGKFVHQPGDNQYSSSTQGERHGGGNGYQVVRQAAPAPNGGWAPVHKNKPDISLEPIVCDEPIARPGFPPVPDALELPGIRGGGSFSAPSSGGGGGGGGAYSGGGGAAPGMAGPATAIGKHQGYETYQPGAFGGGNKTGKGAELYHRPHETYASGDGSAPSESQRALSHLGKEPSLSGKVPEAAPEAPQAVQVNQATTQDLSLPDDQNPNSQKRPSRAGNQIKRMEQNMMNRMMMPLYSMPVRMPTMH